MAAGRCGKQESAHDVGSARYALSIEAYGQANLLDDRQPAPRRVAVQLVSPTIDCPHWGPAATGEPDRHSGATRAEPADLFQRIMNLVGLASVKGPQHHVKQPGRRHQEDKVHEHRPIHPPQLQTTASQGRPHEVGSGRPVLSIERVATCG